MSAIVEILAAIEDETTSYAVEGRYAGDQAADAIRRFLAYVVGTSSGAGGNEHVVLGFQYEGKNTPTPPPSGKNWRCFKVDSFDPTTVKKIAFAPTSPFAPPPPLKFQQLKRQNCVEDVLVWRQKKY